MENKKGSITVQNMEDREEDLPVVGPVILEFIGDTGDEDSLLDINDILTLSVSKIQDHPLAKIVFNKSNPHVKQIKEVVGKDVEEADVLTYKVDPTKEKESRKVKRKSKAKESKRTIKKAKTQRDTTCLTPKIREGKIPVSTKDIYHSRKFYQ